VADFIFSSEGATQVNGNLANVNEGVLVGRDEIDTVEFNHTIAHKVHCRFGFGSVKLGVLHKGQINTLMEEEEEEEEELVSWVNKSKVRGRGFGRTFMQWSAKG